MKYRLLAIFYSSNDIYCYSEPENNLSCWINRDRAKVKDLKEFKTLTSARNEALKIVDDSFKKLFIVDQNGSTPEKII